MKQTEKSFNCIMTGCFLVEDTLTRSRFAGYRFTVGTVSEDMLTTQNTVWRKVPALKHHALAASAWSEEEIPRIF
jgi:hypothetical protein